MRAIAADHTHHMLFEVLDEYTIDTDPEKKIHTVTGCEDGVEIGHTLQLLGEDGSKLTVKVVDIDHYSNARDMWIARVVEGTIDGH